MMRYGLPTQDEINRWDDIQRAKGYEMVRVRPREEYIDLTLNRKGYHVETSEWNGVWTAYLIGGRLGVVCQASGKSRLEALEALAGELGVSL
jgi:hypothetical protein